MVETLYQRLGGYDAIAAVAAALLTRLHTDETIGRFWENRGTDGLEREQQLLIDFLAHTSGGPMLYTGRPLRRSHEGMGITAADWSAFTGHLEDTLDAFAVPATERTEFLDYIDSTRADLVGV